jgi:DNA-directed RNA polymerase specialized sigma24 family protein
LAILTNIKTIIDARNPYAMAHMIAKRSLINLTERAVNKNEIPVSQLDGKEPDCAELSNWDRLEILAGSEENDFPEPGRPSEVTYFPGVRSLWKPQYLRQLEIRLEKAFSQLPTEPVSQSLAIRLWFGMLPECGELSYPEIARVLDLSERQARYQVQQGMSNLRRLMEEEAKQLVQRANERR